jgi:hypothetical protein
MDATGGCEKYTGVFATSGFNIPLMNAYGVATPLFHIAHWFFPGQNTGVRIAGILALPAWVAIVAHYPPSLWRIWGVMCNAP